MTTPLLEKEPAAPAEERPSRWAPVRRFLHRWRGPLIAAFYIILFTACGVAIARMLGPDGFGGVWNALIAIGWQGVGLSALSTVFVFLTMWVMEQFALRDAGAPKSVRNLFATPLISNAMSLGVGFGAVSGAALRVRLYSRAGVDAPSAIFVASYVTAASILGGVLVAAIGFTIASETMLSAVPIEHDVLQMIGVGLLCGFAGLLIASGLRGRTLSIGHRRFKLPSAPGLVIRISLGAIDWLFSAAALFALLPKADISFPTFASVFAGAHAIAMTTGAPAGIGVFDTIMMGLTPPGITTENMAAALISYRIISLVAPMALGLLTLAVIEWRHARRVAQVTGEPEPTLPSLSDIPSLPELPRATGRLAHWFLQTLARRLGMRPQTRAIGAVQTKGDLFEEAAEAAPSTLESIAGEGPILVMAPHPDDEILGCGGLIAACASGGLPVHVAILTDGGRSHLGSRQWPHPRIAAERQGEALEALARLGVAREKVRLLSLPDGSLFRSQRARRVAEYLLWRMAKRVQARSLFVTWRHDPHPDHVAAASIAERIVKRLPGLRIVHYPVWGFFLPSSIRLRDHTWRASKLDVSAQLAAKRAALEAYKTQVEGLITDARIVRAVTPEQQRALMGPYEFYFE